MKFKQYEEEVWSMFDQDNIFFSQLEFTMILFIGYMFQTKFKQYEEVWSMFDLDNIFFSQLEAISTCRNGRELFHKRPDLEIKTSENL